VFALGRGFAFQFGNNALGEHLAQFHTPLVKRINVPNHALREDAMGLPQNNIDCFLGQM
jgi:hypothetical protein